MRKITLLRVNCEIDSVVASKNDTFLLNLSSSGGKSGNSLPANIAFQHLTMCLLTLSLLTKEPLKHIPNSKFTQLTQISKGRRKPWTMEDFPSI